MSTEAQLTANRLNAQSSTGPLTEAGKAFSSQNALKSGLYSQKMIIRGEKLEDLVELQVEYYTHYQPATPVERDLVDILVSSTWQHRRLSRIDAEMYTNTIIGFSYFDPNTIVGKAFYMTDEQHARLERMQKGLQKSIIAAVRELERLQKARPTLMPLPQAAETKPASSPNGFVSSTAPTAPVTAAPAVGQPLSSGKPDALQAIRDNPTAQNTPADPKIVPIPASKEPPIAS